MIAKIRSKITRKQSPYTINKRLRQKTRKVNAILNEIRRNTIQYDKNFDKMGEYVKDFSMEHNLLDRTIEEQHAKYKFIEKNCSDYFKDLLKEEKRLNSRNVYLRSRLCYLYRVAKKSDAAVQLLVYFAKYYTPKKGVKNVRIKLDYDSIVVNHNSVFIRQHEST